ncbi:MAG: head GIN domain-containing protein [Chitinophagaceae bacterium]
MKNWILLSILSLLFASCDKEKQECPGSSEKTFATTGFTKVNAGDAHHLTINKGNEFSIKARGCASDLNDLELTIDANHILNIHYRSYKQNRYRVDFTITMPQLIAVNLSGAAKGTINGFGGQNSVIRTVLSGASECTVSGTGINAAVEISGASKLVLSGNTESLYGNISGASRLEAYDVTATEVDISVSGSSKAYVRPLQVFFAEATGSSHIYYKGNPATKHFETSGNGKIIQE